MTVAVVSPRTLFRQALCTWLGKVEDFHEVMEFNSISELAAIDEKRQPFVVLIHETNSCSAIDSVHELLSLLPEARSILLADDPDNELCGKALGAGAWGCLSTAERLQVLLEVLLKVAGGERLFDSRLTNEVFERIISGQGGPPRLAESLTPRESELLVVLARGHSDKEVARRGPISRETERSYVKEICGELQVTNRGPAALYYFRNIRNPNTLPEHSKRMTDSDFA